MTSMRPFEAGDLWKYNRVNLDPLTETYGLQFYFAYLARWPEYCTVVEAANGQMMGYILGKVEGKGTNWHGHVTALTVQPDYRRLGLANKMMDALEEISEKTYNGYFVDLFVRKSNVVAVELYKRLGYVIYREVINYYSGVEPENAYDMRKALARDPDKKSMVPLGRAITEEELDSTA
eukprot:m.46408 g.46408  ORF g.46408 m.46408 type:complete len:178 (+) comp12533_c0_seq1:174-707(+)